MASDDNLSTDSVNFNRFDWEAAPEPWRSIGLTWRQECAGGIVPRPRRGIGAVPRDLTPPLRQTSTTRPLRKASKPPEAAVIAKPVAIMRTRYCADCTWSGRADEYADHRRTDHALGG